MPPHTGLPAGLPAAQVQGADHRRGPRAQRVHGHPHRPPVPHRLSPGQGGREGVREPPRPRARPPARWGWGSICTPLLRPGSDHTPPPAGPWVWVSQPLGAPPETRVRPRAVKDPLSRAPAWEGGSCCRLPSPPLAGSSATRTGRGRGLPARCPGSPSLSLAEAPAAEAAHHVGHAAGGGLHAEPAALPRAAPGRQGAAGRGLWWRGRARPRGSECPGGSLPRRPGGWGRPGGAGEPG